MAKFSAVTESEVSFSTVKTVLNLTGGTTRRLEVTGLGVSFDGISSTDAPVYVRIVRTTAAPTGTACTEKTWNDAAATPVGAAVHTATVEGTKESVSLITAEVHPQGGSMVLSWARGEGIIIPATSGAGLSIECTAGATVNAAAWIEWWE